MTQVWQTHGPTASVTSFDRVLLDQPEIGAWVWRGQVSGSEWGFVVSLLLRPPQTLALADLDDERPTSSSLRLDLCLAGEWQSVPMQGGLSGGGDPSDVAEPAQLLDWLVPFSPPPPGTRLGLQLSRPSTGLDLTSWWSAAELDEAQRAAQRVPS